VARRARRRAGKSRAALLREAVSAFRAAIGDWIDRGFGSWRHRDDIRR
jgi:hypothetical protein